jgi:hypothetical protein
VGTVFFRVLGHNGCRLKDAIGANSTLYHCAFSFSEEIRRHATEKDWKRRTAVSQVEAIGEILDVFLQRSRDHHPAHAQKLVSGRVFPGPQFRPRDEINDGLLHAAIYYVRQGGEND